MTIKLTWIQALTPTHVGTGKSVGVVDLPIVREKCTGWPIFPGSAIKGVLSAHHGAGGTRNGIARIAFGAVKDEVDDGNSGSLCFTDARILFLPVRSLYGTFAWVTSRHVLQRFARDIQLAGGVLPKLPVDQELNSALVSSQGSALLAPNSQDNTSNVFLEDLDFQATPSDELKDVAAFVAERVFPDDESGEWQALFQSRVVLLPDLAFNFFCETGMEVNAHVQIDPETRTVANKMLWYEECLPAESILYGLAICEPPPQYKDRKDDIMKNYLTDSLSLQIGGKATVGKGQIAVSFSTFGGQS